jgi:aspartate/methionine/tyrosine aminotransferase
MIFTSSKMRELFSTTQRTPGIEDLSKISVGMSDLINLGLGELDFNTPNHIKKAAKKAINEEITRYTPVEGLLELRKAISKKYSEKGVDYDANSEVLITSGASEAMTCAIFSIVDSGDEFILTDLCYTPFVTKIRMAGGVPIQVKVKEERDFRIDPEDIEKKITRRTKAIVIISPDNPTGAVLTRDDTEAIAELAKQYDLLVISDELYGYAYDGGEVFTISSIPEMKDRTITIDGVSKVYAMTGWRVGWLLANKDIIRIATRLHSLYTYTVNSIAQMAAIAALTGPQDSVRKMALELEKRRNLLVEGLNSLKGVRCRKPLGGYYAYPNVNGTGMSSFDFAKYVLEKAHVLIYPANAFGKGGEGYLRAGFLRSREEIQEALNRIYSLPLLRT